MLLRGVLLLVVVVNTHAGFSVPNFVGRRSTIVHLFEWKWPAIAQECEKFLGPRGFAGVQVSPPSEHIYHKIYHDGKTDFTWWSRYQPVSYEINSRSGGESEFKDMVQRCNKVGVRIYVDAVINHMANDNSYEFPKVPYHWWNFHAKNGKCDTDTNEIKDYSNAHQVRYCELNGLDDLDYSVPQTVEKVVGYLNKLLSYGVAGFRIDAAKHMLPSEIQNVVNKLEKTIFGTDPYIYQEVIAVNDLEPIKSSEYVSSGDVTEFKFCYEIEKLGKGTKALRDFRTLGEEWGLLDSSQALVFVDNHDNQRGHGGGGHILTFKDSAAYKKATAFTLAWNYGIARIMSSYQFTNGEHGPPCNENGDTLPPQIKNDGSCDGDWVCEHRWRQIRNMACFRNAAELEPVWNWRADEQFDFISFSRGSNAFFAISNDKDKVIRWVPTGLSPGTYCDLISGDPTDTGCTGQTITVNDHGWAEIILHPGEDSMIALTARDKAGSGGGCKWN
nr:alpha-amylase-like [Lytechinus pictus]